MYCKHHAVPARIGRDDAHGQRLLEQPDAAIGLRQQRRRIDEGALDAARGDFFGEDRRPGRHAQPRPETFAAAGSDRNDHVAVTAIGRVGIAGDVQADLPQRLAADKIGAFWEWFH